MSSPNELASVALHSHSFLDLLMGLTAYMQACEAADEDSGDILGGFAPFHDCAARIGADPVWVFDMAARRVGGKTGELARTFGRRNRWGYLLAGSRQSDSGE
jgi:hypothetical protein